MIIGRKVNLRLIRKSDLSSMVKWRNKKGIRECFFNQTPLDMISQRKWFASYLKNPREKMFIIQTKKNVPIGTIGLNNINKKNRTADFGRIMIGDKRYLGRGLAKDASVSLINYCLNTLGIRRLYLQVLASNQRAIRLYQSCGFKKQDRIKKRVSCRDQSFQRQAIVMSLKLY